MGNFEIPLSSDLSIHFQEKPSGKLIYRVTWQDKKIGINWEEPCDFNLFTELQHALAFPAYQPTHPIPLPPWWIGVIWQVPEKNPRYLLILLKPALFVGDFFYHGETLPPELHHLPPDLLVFQSHTYPTTLSYLL